ncbi:sensor histidine kinase [Sciscionella sediminilitoris]|uniref:sensor histidine kinase n=1 Tax=Sciscionella sediminilitoris TaxID=1445613 RepID=UPI0004DF5315|nr:sensor domain-containing protein [Sciscionella sp. SE31]
MTKAGYVARGIALSGLALYGVLLVLWLCVVATFSCIGVGVPLLSSAFGAIRGLARTGRRLARDWSGVSAPEPEPEPDFGPGVAAGLRRLHWRIGDATMWRELGWAVVNPVSGAVSAFVPAALALNGLFGIVLAALWWQGIHLGTNNWYAFIPMNSAASPYLALVFGLVQLAVCVPVAPLFVRGHAALTAGMLRPSERTRLNRRVEHLTRTRTEATDSQASELRRIERDLHDGAQARLVAMGMTIDAAENLLESNPEAVRALLSEVKASSRKALDELRDLVRGIHPPVLADRGLADAIRALVMESPLRVDVTAELSGRAAPPIESAAYFAASEAFSNIVKHAHATSAEIRVSHREGMLRVEVGDNGCGGADPARGTGLAGVERRLGSFDGFVTVVSPVGGPTLVTIAIPCELDERTAV